MSDEQEKSGVAALIDVMAALRTPETGCPWDLEQTFESIAPYTIEEAYEVADAITNGSREDLKEELGDLLLQVVYHAQIAQEEGAFAFDDVAQGITDKMIRRHPHVFGQDCVAGAEAMRVKWEDLKAAETAQKQARSKELDAAFTPSALDGVALALPALSRAQKLQRKASRVGFDWPDRRGVVAKIAEEIDEVNAAFEQNDSVSVREEIGDLLFAVVNLARHADVDAERALVAANDKFARRFSFIEARLREDGRNLTDTSLEDMDALWKAAKNLEQAE